MALAMAPVLLCCHDLWGQDPANITEIALLMAYDEMGQECEQGGNLDRALFWYTLGMKTHPLFYECRFVRFNVKDRKGLETKLKTRRPVPGIGFPWSRETKPQSVVYVYGEGQLSDTIQFSRYLNCLVRDGYRVLFRPQDPLEELMAYSLPGVVVLDSSLPEETLPFDSYVPLLSLPHHYLTKVESLPYAEGYLKPDPVRAEWYRDAHFNLDAYKIGVVWQGSPDRFNDGRRSIQLADFLPLSEIEGVQLYAFQIDCGGEQLLEIHDDRSMIDVGSTFETFADCAAAIVNLDLLISVDSSVAHLSGALGRPTWILIPYVSDWRWFRRGERTPWYFNSILFRQEREGDWASVMQRIKERLIKMVTSRACEAEKIRAETTPVPTLLQAG